MKTMQKSMAEDTRRRRRRRCHGDEHLQQQPAGRRSVVVLRETRLELCHPDDFHALRHVDLHSGADLEDEAALPLVCPQHRAGGDERPSSPATCTCDGGCCSGSYDDNLVPDDVIPLPVQYVAAQDDDDDDDDDDYDVNDDDDDDSGCSDSSRRLISK